MEEEILDIPESIPDANVYSYICGVPLEAFAAVEPGSGLSGLYAAMNQWTNRREASQD